MIPVPERTVEGKQHWYVWLLVPREGGREYRLRMVRK